MLSRLLVDHSDLELASIRLIPNEDGTVGIAGRIGQLVEQTAEYDCCHQLEGRPHTEYCINSLPSSGEGVPLPVITPGGFFDSPEQAATALTHGITEPVWVDDGCRCHVVDQHMHGCPAQAVICKCPDTDNCQHRG